MSELTPQSFIKPLTGLRVFAAMWVVILHFTVHSGLSLPALSPLILHGYMGVDLFFVLSGFIIHHVYRDIFSPALRKADYFDFIRNRFARIYPMHFVTLVVMTVFYVYWKMTFHSDPDDVDPFEWPDVLVSLILMHAWSNGVSPNTPSWSVSSEWFAYLVYPFTVKIFGKFGVVVKLIISILSLVAVSQTEDYEPILRILPEFLLGMIICDFSKRWQNRGPIVRLSGLLIAGTIIACCYLVPWEHREVFVLLFALLIGALAGEKDWLGVILAAPPLVYLGEISYSIYMTHIPVLAFLANAAHRYDINIATSTFFFGGIGMVLIVSAAAFHLIELPARRAIRAKDRPIIEVTHSEAPTA